MGQQSSKSSSGNSNTSNANDSQPKSLVEIIGYVASNYILGQSFNDMKRLADPQYCNKLVIVTSNILKNYLNTREVKYLAQKIKDGQEVNEIQQEQLTYLMKGDLDKIDIRDQTEKKRMCIGIARFYVKVAHVFAAIVTTVNPEYTYSNAAGEKVKVPLAKKSMIPEDASTKMSRNGICSKRIKALAGTLKLDQIDDPTVTLKPEFCGMNLGPSGIRALSSEPGIPELKRLYFDVYNFETGNYSSMSPKMKEQYQSDVKSLYKIFTGRDNVPSDIKNFGDIKLRDFHNSSGCSSNGAYKKGYTGSTKDTLYAKYINHIKEMMETAKKNQDALLEVIDILFAFSVNPQTLKKEITINPQLNEQLLDKAVDMTRTMIIKTYAQCEEDFTKGLQIFEAIVEKQIMDTTAVRIDGLKDAMEKEIAQETSFTNEQPAPIAQTPVAPAPAPAPEQLPGEQSEAETKVVEAEKAGAEEQKPVVNENPQIPIGEPKLTDKKEESEVPPIGQIMQQPQLIK